MRLLTFLTFLAQSPVSPEFHPAEVLFFKFAGFVVLLLWIIYLVKDIFFSHKEDPRLAALIGGMSQTNVQLATITANLQHIAEAGKEQREREKEMWVVINGIRRSLTSMAEDHAHLEGQAISAGLKPEPRRPH